MLSWLSFGHSLTIGTRLFPTFEWIMVIPVSFLEYLYRDRLPFYSFFSAWNSWKKLYFCTLQQFQKDEDQDSSNSTHGVSNTWSIKMATSTRTSDYWNTCSDSIRQMVIRVIHNGWKRKEIEGGQVEGEKIDFGVWTILKWKHNLAIHSKLQKYCSWIGKQLIGRDKSLRDWWNIFGGINLNITS